MDDGNLKTAQPRYRRSSRNRGRLVWLVAAALVLAVAAGVWFFVSGSEEPLTSAETQEPRPAPENESSEEVAKSPPQIKAEAESASSEVSAPVQPSTRIPTPEPLPALETSDSFVRDAVAGWDLPSDLVSQEDLLSRLSVVIANAADGQVPRRLSKAFAPTEKFGIVERAGQVYIDPETYARYDRAMRTLEGIEPQTAAAFVNRVEPLLARALSQFGESRSPDALIKSAVQRLNALPELPESVAVVQREAVYEYADQNLESLPDFEKQALRLGPENLARLKAWLNAFMNAYTS